VKKISLTQNQFTLVDDEDYEYLSQWKWCAHRQSHRAGKQFNAVRNTVINRKHTTILMHRLIMKPPAGTIIDHKDGNPLNNQKNNLRFATHSTNGANTGLRRNNKSGYKGVHWCNLTNKWCAQIRVKGQSINLGRFIDITDAVEAYNTAALKHYGEFAYVTLESDTD
jgi:hypothetical protein